MGLLTGDDRFGVEQYVCLRAWHPLQNLLWDGVPSVASLLEDSSLGKMRLDFASSNFTTAFLDVFASALGCRSDYWAATALNVSARAGINLSQFNFR